MALRITVVGACNVDFTFRAPRLPDLGETLAGHTFHFDFGGKAANQAVSAARLGANVTLIGRVGSDRFGRLCIEQLTSEGIDVRQVLPTAGQATGAAAIFLNDAGQNAIIGVPGANAQLSAADVAEATEAIRSSQVVLATLEVPQEAVHAAFAAAREAGAMTFLNPAPVFPVSDDLLRLVDYCTPNEGELGQLTGLRGETLAVIEASARSLLRRGVRNVIATLGDRGALWVNDEQILHVPAMPVQAVDTTGAGDSFSGSLAVFLAEGESLPNAIRAANRVAARTVSRLGTQASFPRRSEIHLR